MVGQRIYLGDFILRDGERRDRSTLSHCETPDKKFSIKMNPEK